MKTAVLDVTRGQSSLARRAWAGGVGSSGGSPLGAAPTRKEAYLRIAI